MITLTLENLQLLVDRLSIAPYTSLYDKNEREVQFYDFSPAGGVIVFRDNDNIFLSSLTVSVNAEYLQSNNCYRVQTYCLTGGRVQDVSYYWCWRIIDDKIDRVVRIFDGNQIVTGGDKIDVIRFYVNSTGYPFLDTAYSNVLFRQLYQTSYFASCFIKGSQVKLANGDYKNIEDVEPGDTVQYISDEGAASTTVVVAPPHRGTCSEYTNYIFEDGTILPIYKDQGIWCEEKQKYITVLEWEIGWTTKKIDNTLTKLVDKQLVQKEEGVEDFEHYFLYTYNGNYSVNDVLTCTSRAKSLQAYNDEISKGSAFLLPKEQVVQWERQVTMRNRKEQPLLNPIYHSFLIDSENTINHNLNVIETNKVNLNDTDYKIQKYLEGVLPIEEFEEIKKAREGWRAEINRLEEENKLITNNLSIIKHKFEMKPTHPDYPSIAPDTQVLMADGTYKAIKDIKVGEEVCYLSDDKQHVRNSLVVLPVEPEYVWEYKIYKFSDGTELKLHGQTNLFSIELNKYRPDKEMKVGDIVRKFDGTEVAIESIELIKLDHEEIFYRLSTFNGNFTINDMLTLVSRIRIYDELMWEENEPFRLSDEEMEKWKNWCDARRK